LEVVEKPGLVDVIWRNYYNKMNNYGKTHWRNQCENYKKTHPDADGYRSGSGYAEYIRHGSV